MRALNFSDCLACVHGHSGLMSVGDRSVLGWFCTVEGAWTGLRSRICKASGTTENVEVSRLSESILQALNLLLASISWSSLSR